MYKNGRHLMVWYRLYLFYVEYIKLSDEIIFIIIIDTLNDVLSNTYFWNCFFFIMSNLNKIYFHNGETSYLVFKWKNVLNSFSINKFMMLKYLFYIIFHKLSNYFHEWKHKCLNVSIIIIDILCITKFYIQNVFVLNYLNSIIYIKNIDRFSLERADNPVNLAYNTPVWRYLSASKHSFLAQIDNWDQF